ncbi:hypothetical protein EON65_50955 [archaeon]|nr:MAG: hypothetical protein EON65_50955 [archaeon]
MHCLDSDECFHVLSSLPSVIRLYVLFVFDRYGIEHAFATRLVDLLLPHVSHVQTMTTTFVSLMAAEVYMLKSLTSFSSAESLKIINKKAFSYTLESYIHHFDDLSSIVTSSLPHLKHLHVEGFQEIDSYVIICLAYQPGALNSLQLTSMAMVDKVLLDILCKPETSRIWESLVFEGCPKISLDDLYGTIRDKDYKSRNWSTEIQVRIMPGWTFWSFKKPILFMSRWDMDTFRYCSLV